MFDGIQLSRAQKTGMGVFLAALGLVTMLTSPYIALALPFLAGIITYHVVFLVGFIETLYGVGFVLLANNLWGH